MKRNFTFLSKSWLHCGLVAALAFTSFGLQAQVAAPAIEWDKAFGGNRSEEPSSLQQTSDGGFILGATTQSDLSGDVSEPRFSNGMSDYWIIKTDIFGNKLWDKRFGGTDSEHLITVKQTSDKGYILGGNSYSDVSGNKTSPLIGQRDIWIVKTDSLGNKQWDKSFGTPQSVILKAISQTNDGGYLLGGMIALPINSGSDIWLIKLDANGNQQWSLIKGGNENDLTESISKTSDGGYIIGASSLSGVGLIKTTPNNGIFDYWIIKTDSIGNTIWEKTFGGSNRDNLVSVQQTPDKGYILAGTSLSNISGNKSENSKGNSDYWIIKTDSLGNIIWDKTIGSTGIDGLSSLQQTVDGGYLLGGTSSGNISGDKTQNRIGSSDYWLVKLDNNGNIVWDKTIGSTYGEFKCFTIQLKDESYLIGGESPGGIGGDKTQASKGYSDLWIVKLAADITGLKETKTSFNISIYPNPSQGKFNLQLNNLNVAEVEVTVTDLLGRVVWQRDLAVTGSQLFEEVTLPAVKGMYLLQLKAGQELVTRKVVVE